jgi:type I restriction enzyme S subunit
MSSEEWRTFKLGDIAEIVGGGTPSTAKDEYWSDDIPWITPRDLSGSDEKYISRGERNISQNGLENSSAKLLPAGTVLLSTRAPIGYLRIALNPLSTNQGFKSLITKPDLVSNEFLYYLLKSQVSYLKSVGVGSTFAEISGGTLSRLEFRFPPLHEQIKIVEILSLLDEKIDLNHKTNQTLQEIAQAIFKEWFVDFNYPGATGEMVDSKMGLLPKGWRIQNLGELSSTITKGTTPTTLGDNFVEKGVRFLRVDCIDETYGIDESKSLFITQETHEKLRRSQLMQNDILITIAGSIGRLSIVSERVLPANLNQAIGIIRIDENIVPVNYIFQYLKQPIIRNKLLSGVTQSVQANISLQDLRSLLIIIPSKQILLSYKIILGVIQGYIDNNNNQSTSLQKIRDLLLSKFMRGDSKL